MLRRVEHGFYLRETALQVESLLVTEKLCLYVIAKHTFSKKCAKCVLKCGARFGKHTHFQKQTKRVLK